MIGSSNKSMQWGILLSILSALFTSSGLCLQKLYVRKNRVQGTINNYRILYYAGVLYVAVGLCVKAFIYLLLPQVAIAILSVQTLLYTTLLESLAIKWKLNYKIVSSFILTSVGMCIAVYGLLRCFNNTSAGVIFTSSVKSYMGGVGAEDEGVEYTSNTSSVITASATTASSSASADNPVAFVDITGVIFSLQSIIFVCVCFVTMTLLELYDRGYDSNGGTGMYIVPLKLLKTTFFTGFIAGVCGTAAKVLSESLYYYLYSEKNEASNDSGGNGSGAPSVWAVVALAVITVGLFMFKGRAVRSALGEYTSSSDRGSSSSSSSSSTGHLFLPRYQSATIIFNALCGLFILNERALINNNNNNNNGVRMFYLGLVCVVVGTLTMSSGGSSSSSSRSGDGSFGGGGVDGEDEDNEEEMSTFPFMASFDLEAGSIDAAAAAAAGKHPIVSGRNSGVDGGVGGHYNYSAVDDEAPLRSNAYKYNSTSATVPRDNNNNRNSSKLTAEQKKKLEIYHKASQKATESINNARLAVAGVKSSTLPVAGAGVGAAAAYYTDAPWGKDMSYSNNGTGTAYNKSTQLSSTSTSSNGNFPSGNREQVHSAKVKSYGSAMEMDVSL